MGWFDLFRRSSVERLDDLVWLTELEKHQGLVARLRRRLDEDQLIIVITHFPETFNQMQDCLEQAGLDYRIVNQRMHGAGVLELMSESPRIAMVPAAAVIEGEEIVAAVNAPKISIFVAERHPTRTPDHMVEAFARSIPCSIRLSYYLSAEDPCLPLFVSPAGVELLRTVGAKNQAVSSRMITRRITRAQRRIEQQVGRPQDAESPREWVRLNLP